MNSDRRPANTSDSVISARNKQYVLDYQDALSKSDLNFVESALDQNFMYIRLEERFSRYEYLDALSRTLLAAKTRRLTVLGCLADEHRVALEVFIAFEFQGTSVRGQYHSVYEIENGRIAMLREYGGLLNQADTAGVA